MSVKGFFTRVWAKRRGIWWAALTASLLILVVLHPYDVGAHDPTFLYKGVLGLVALLLLLPLFSEVEGFGFRFKQWEQFKREVRDDIRQEIRMVASAQVTNIFAPGPYRPEELKELLKHKSEIEAEGAADLPVVAKAVAALEGRPTVPDSAKQVFELTYPIAKELLLLWKETKSGVAFPPPLPTMANDLARDGVVSEPVMTLLRPLVWIDNVVRAGQDVTSEELDYARQTAPGVQRWLHARRLALKSAVR
jgi:hypothetical protein